MKLCTALAGLLCWSAIGLAHGASAVFVPAPSPAVVHFAVDETEDLVTRLRLLGDRVPVETLARLAKIGTPDALAGFELALDGGVLKSDVARARAVRALAGFAKNKDLSGRVREMLANYAVNAQNSIEGLAAVETLGASGGIAREWLKRVVEGPAMSVVRVRALELHIEGYEAKYDAPWYRELWQSSVAATEESSAGASGELGSDSAPVEEAAPTAGRPLGSLGAQAFQVLAHEFDDATLKSAMEHRSARVRAAAMLELSDRGDTTMTARARAAFQNSSFTLEERVVGAAVFGHLQGWDEVFKEVARALDTTPRDGGRSMNDTVAGRAFVDALADLIAARGDATFVKAVLRDGAALEPASVRAFCARALGRVDDKGAERFLKDLLADKELVVRIEALRTLTRRGTDGARKLLDAQLNKASTEVERGILVELTTELFGGDPKWIAELEDMAAGEPTEVKNAALASLARVGGAYEDLFARALTKDAPWGTKRAAIVALRDLRSREAIVALIAALGQTDGRAQDEVLEALRQLTGERFRNAGVWPKWWADNGATFQPLTAKEYADLIAQRDRAEDASLRQAEGRTAAATFFGIELNSDRLAFVIDASGSMAEPMTPRTGGRPGPTTGGGGSDAHVPKGGTRLEVARNELLHFLTQLPTTAMVNVVRFSDGTDRWSERLASVAQSKTFSSIKAYVERLNPSGGTNVYAALQAAFEDPDVDMVMFLSDGTPSVGEYTDLGTIAEHVRIWNANRGVTLHVLSIGVDQPILRALAEESGGSYTLVR